jgi:hypothetical protein
MHHAPSEKFFSRAGKRSVSHTLSQLSSPAKKFGVVMTKNDELRATNAHCELTDPVNGF